jgi:hypothetical protein
MAYFKVPKNWSEDDCIDAVMKLLSEGQDKLKKEKYEKSSYCFIQIAQIIRSIPELKRKKIINEILLRKQLRNDKKNGNVSLETF